MKAPFPRRRRPIAEAAPTVRSRKITTAVVPPEQVIVERLQHVLADIDRLPLPTGKLGCQFLDALELTDKIREKVRARAKELLLKAPTAIPNWHVNEIPMRTLSKDTAKVFDVLSRADDGLSLEAFVEACTTSLGAVRKLIAERNPDWTADQVEYVLNHSLESWIHYETVTRLVAPKIGNLISRSMTKSHFETL
jgi:hypothetical protein